MKLSITEYILQLGGEDLKEIKKQFDILSDKLIKILELKNFDGPDDIKEEHYNNIKEIKNMVYLYCGIDVDTDGYEEAFAKNMMNIEFQLFDVLLYI